MATPTEATDNPTDPRPGRSSLPTAPLFAVVGATDLAVQQVRAAAAGASSIQRRFQSDIEARLAGVEKRVGALDPKTLRSQAEQAPTRAVARALEVANKAEAAYEELARRGKDLVDRVYTQADGPTLVSQAGTTFSQGRAAVTVARRAAGDTASSVLRSSLNLGRTDSAKVADDAVNEVQLDREAVQKAVEVGDGGNQPAEPVAPVAPVAAVAPVTPRTRTAAKKTSTPRKNATATQAAVKSTRARKSPAAGKPQPGSGR